MLLFDILCNVDEDLDFKTTVHISISWMNNSWSTQTKLYHNLLIDVFSCYQWNIHKPYLISSDIIWCYIDKWYLFSGEHRHLFPVKSLCPRYGRYFATLFMVCGTVSDGAKKGEWNVVSCTLNTFWPHDARAPSQYKDCLSPGMGIPMLKKDGRETVLSLTWESLYW